MLTVLIGPDTKQRSARLDALLSPLKKQGADIRSYSDVTFNTDELRSIAGMSSLFGTPIAVTLTGIGDVAESREAFEHIAKELAESQQHFFLSETALLAAFLKRMKSVGAVVEESGEKTKGKKAEVFNIFSLTDAYADRKRSLAWALYRQAIGAGLEPREIAGKLFWSIKTVLAADAAPNAPASGLHPFVYGKSKRAAKNFRTGELAMHARELTTLFHQSMLSGIDFETALEAFVLRSLEKMPVV